MIRSEHIKNAFSFAFALTLFAAAIAAPAATAREPKIRVLSEQELVDLMIGACIQSTRGCEAGDAIADIKKALADGKEFKLISTEGFPADGMVVAV